MDCIWEFHSFVVRISLVRMLGHSVVERDCLPDTRIWVIAIGLVIELGSTHATCASFLQMEDSGPQRLTNLHVASQLAFRRPESVMASLAS